MCWKKTSVNWGSLYSEELSFKYKGEIKTNTNKRNQFTTN